MNGFADERKKTGTSTSPSTSTSRPRASTAHAATACTDSTAGPRVTSTSGTPVLFCRTFDHLDESGRVDPLCECRADALGREREDTFRTAHRLVEREVAGAARREAGCESRKRAF